MSPSVHRGGGGQGGQGGGGGQGGRGRGRHHVMPADLTTPYGLGSAYFID